MSDETLPLSGVTRPERGRTIIRRDPDSRGRPADAERTAPSASQGTGAPAASIGAAGASPDPYDMSQYSRRPMGEGDDNPFQVPPHLQKPGWDYEFKTTKVMGEPARASDQARERNQGWRPVPAADIAEMLPPGHDQGYFEIDGQILMMRPKKLSVEAKAELYEKAERQKRDKLQSALASDPTGNFVHDARMPRRGTSITLEGEVGVHEQRYER